MDLGRLRASAQRVSFRFMRPGSVPTPGVHRSLFRGHGLNFAGYREYQHGDDIRMVDWNVTARQNRPMLKLFEQEHATALMLVLDASPSMTGPHPDKWDAAAALAVLFAFVGARDGERMGLAITGEKGLAFSPRRGFAHATRMAHRLERPGGALAAARPAPGTAPAMVSGVVSGMASGMRSATAAGTRPGQALDEAIHRALRSLRTPGVLVVASDFLGTRWDAAIREAVRRHTVVGLTIATAFEHELPAAGLVRVQDAESGATRWVDTGSAKVRAAYAQRSTALRSEIRARLVDAGAVPVAIRTDRPLIGQLASICRVRGAA
jgi:uncharacterized protein (DUF58 family)